MPMFPFYKKAITIGQMVYGFPSFILLWLFFVLPFLRREIFKSPNYKLLQFDLFMNILCYINSWIAIRLIRFETGYRFLVFLEENVPNTLMTSRCLILVFFHIQNASLIALSVHRTNSVYSLDSEKIWKRGYIISFAICLLFPLGIYILCVFTDSVPTKVMMINGEINFDTNPVKLSILANYTAFVAIYYFVLILGLGICAYNKLRERRQKSRSSGKRHGRKMKRTIIIQLLLNSGNLILLMTVAIAHHLLEPGTVHDIWNICVTFTSDMATLNMPYLLLKFDFNVRCLFGLKKNAVIRTSSIYSLQTSTNYVIN